MTEDVTSRAQIDDLDRMAAAAPPVTAPAHLVERTAELLLLVRTASEMIEHVLHRAPCDEELRQVAWPEDLDGERFAEAMEVTSTNAIRRGLEALAKQIARELKTGRF